MFLKSGVFKRLIGEAYKGPGLIVGRSREEDEEDEGYYLSGGYWIIWVKKGYLPKKEKAAIIELIGDLPERGEAFRAEKDHDNQYEIEFKELYNLPEKFKDCKCQFRVTRLLIHEAGVMSRVLQERKTRHVTGIGQTFINLVDPEAVDYDNGEIGPEGPVAPDPESKYMCWGNNVSYLLAFVREPSVEKEQAFLRHLEGVEIS